MTLRIPPRPPPPPPPPPARPAAEKVAKKAASPVPPRPVAPKVTASKAAPVSPKAKAPPVAPKAAVDAKAAPAAPQAVVETQAAPASSLAATEASLAPQARAVAGASNVSVSKDSRFSSDFKTWLQDNGYGDYSFAKGDVPSFGGRSQPGEKLTQQPVIFIHGNSDSAAGWKKSIEGFADQGYKPSEMYAMTWGDQSPLLASQQHHSRKNEEEVRAFIQAVKEYTGAEKVDVIGHSMGVTLARKAIQGGDGFDPYPGGGKYDLGAPLTQSVDAFVGIAGANHGLASAAFTGNLVPTTNRETGLHPFSNILRDINATPHDEGSHVYSIWSHVDEILGVGIAGTTGPIPGQDGQKVYSTFPFGHMGSRDLSVDTQVSMVRDHVVR